MKVRFWGVRGSISSPGIHTSKYGGNTSCIEIRGDNNELLIIDAGTGIRELGNYIVADSNYNYKNISKKSYNINIFITHTHWDHIQGFPFFLPLYFRNFNITLWGPINIMSKSLEEIMSQQMSYTYFPVRLDELRAKLSFQELTEEKRYVNSFHIETIYLNHPILCLGYKIIHNDKVVVTLYDNEPYYNLFQEYPTREKDVTSEKDLDSLIFVKNSQEMDYYVHEKNKKFYEFIKNADLLISDAQYTDSEYLSKMGWGHSSISFCLDLARKGNVKRLSFFHHDPIRKDRDLDIMQAVISDDLERNQAKFKAFFAKEKLEITL